MPPPPNVGIVRNDKIENFFGLLFTGGFLTIIISVYLYKTNVNVHYKPQLVLIEIKLMRHWGDISELGSSRDLEVES